MENGRVLIEAPVVGKYLISSPCNFTGEFEGRFVKITHAWCFGRPEVMTDNSPDQQKFFVVEIDYSKIDTSYSNNPFHDSSAALSICGILSVFYGKVFYFHGAFEEQGLYIVPQINYIHQKYKMAYPYNNIPRKETKIECRLEELNRIKNILDLLIPPEEADNFKEFLAATKQYLLSIRYANNDPDIAYLSLVESGEILSNSIKIEESELYDPEILTLLNEIRFSNNGERKYNLIKSSLRQIKRRYLRTIMNYLDEEFYANPYTEHLHCSFSRMNVEGYIKGSYDLRSRYVHRGETFGNGTMPLTPYNWDFNNGYTSTTSDDMKMVIQSAASFTGLERITRYVLFKYLENMNTRLINMT